MDRYAAERAGYTEAKKRRELFHTQLDNIRALRDALTGITEGRGGHHVEMNEFGKGQLTLKTADGKMLFFTVDPVPRWDGCKCEDLFNHDDDCRVFPKVPF